MHDAYDLDLVYICIPGYYMYIYNMVVESICLFGNQSLERGMSLPGTGKQRARAPENILRKYHLDPRPEGVVSWLKKALSRHNFK